MKLQFNILTSRRTTANQEQDIVQSIQQVYFRRWLILIAFGLLSIANVMQLVSYSPIWSSAAIYYGISDQDLSWLGNMYYITFFTLAPFCIKPLEYRLDYTIMLSAALSAIGTWVVWIAQDSFIVTLVGFFIIGIPDAVILIAPVYIADKWFSPYERAYATCILSFFQYVGMAFAYSFSSYYFDGILDQVDINVRIETMNLMIAIINTVALGLCLLFVQNRPPTPPSNSDQISRDSLWDSTYRMISDETNLIDLASLGIFIGCGWVYTTIISIQLYPFGYSQGDVAINGTVYQMSGIVLGLWASAKLDQQASQGIQPDYDIYIKGFTTVGFISIVLEAFIIEYIPMWFLIILNFMIGVGLNAFYPIAIQSYVEKLYPADELMMVTGLLCFANAVGFILNFILVLPQFVDYGLWIGCLIITPGYLHILLNFKTKYKRFESEV